MPNELTQSRIFAQPLEVIQALPSQSVEQYETLHERRFVVSALPLLHMHVLSHATRQPQRTKRLHQERGSSHRRQNFLCRLRVNLKKQFRLRRRWPIQLSHSFDCILLSSPTRCLLPLLSHFFSQPRTPVIPASQVVFTQSSVWPTAAIDGLGTRSRRVSARANSRLRGGQEPIGRRAGHFPPLPA